MKIHLTIVDHLNNISHSKVEYDEEKYDSISAMAHSILLKSLQQVYNCSTDVLEKYKSIYGDYPTVGLINVSKNPNAKEIELNRILNISRSMKINKIMKCT